MAFADLLQHTMTVMKSATTLDAELGSVVTYTERAADLPCLCNTASASTREQFAQQGQVVTHTVATAYGGTQPGDRLDVAGVGPLRVVGIRTQPGVGSIQSFTYLHCETYGG